MGNIRMYGSTSGYTELAPPTVAPDGVLSLPSGTGTIAKTTDQGLVLISPTSIANSGGTATATGGEVTFTTVTSVSLNGVFTATYDNYRVIINCVSSGTTANFSIRARNAGTDVTGATEYYNLLLLINDTGGPTRSSTSGSSFIIGNMGDVQTLAVLDFGGPFLSTKTVCTGSNFERSTVDARLDTYSGARATVASHDGFTISCSSGTTTGKVRVYGYKNS